jgi:hypothetical protein
MLLELENYIEFKNILRRIKWKNYF